MTLTKSQRLALKLAMESLKRDAQRVAFDANVAVRDPNAPPVMQRALEYHKQLAWALQTLEEMLRGVQGELKL